MFTSFVPLFCCCFVQSFKHCILQVCSKVHLYKLQTVLCIRFVSYNSLLFISFTPPLWHIFRIRVFTVKWCKSFKSFTSNNFYFCNILALEKLGFGDYQAEAEAVLKDCKAVAAKRRRQSTRLENLGIPEEELLRQQQELFAKARQEQAYAEQQQWEQLQAAAQQAQASALPTNDDQDDYS